MRTVRAPVTRWLPHAVAALVLAWVTVAGVRYLWNAVPSPSTKTAVVAPVVPAGRPPPPAAVAKRKLSGGLRVTSTPAAAQVFLDGKARGVTPLTINDLPVGHHLVELKSVAGTVERTVTIAADQTAEMEESIFSGWVAVYSPFDVVTTEGGRSLLMDDRHQIMLPPGRHVLRFVNRALAYDAVREVNLKPGEVTTLTVAPPPSTITVTATEAAEVWIDGTRAGDTPLNSVSIPLGSHEIVVKRAAGGERRITATVTVNPFTLHVDFSRPAG
jgi:PEGA domain